MIPAITCLFSKSKDSPLLDMEFPSLSLNNSYFDAYIDLTSESGFTLPEDSRSISWA